MSWLLDLEREKSEAEAKQRNASSSWLLALENGADGAKSAKSGSWLLDLEKSAEAPVVAPVSTITKPSSQPAPPRPLAVVDDPALSPSVQKALNERLGKAFETLDSIKKSGDRNVRIRDEGDLSGLEGRVGPRLETPDMAYERYIRELESVAREYENYRKSGQEYDAGASAIGGHHIYNPAPAETAGMHDPVNTLANVLAFGGAGAAKAVQAGAGNLSNMIRMAGAEGLQASPADIAKALLSPAPRAFARSAAQVLASEVSSEAASRGAEGLMDYAGVEDPAVRAILQGMAGSAGGLIGPMAVSKAIAPPNVKPTLRVRGTQVADDLERMALNTSGTSTTAKGVASVMDDLQGVGSPPSVGQGVISSAIGPGDPNSLAASLLRERGNTDFGQVARMMSDLANGGRKHSIDDIVSILRRNPSRRIDSGSVIDQYGESALDSLPLGTDSVEGKTSIDEMAVRLGYKNRDSLIADLSAYRKREAQQASQAIQNELGMSPEDVARYTGQAPQDAEWPYSNPSLQVTPEQRRSMEFGTVKRDAAASASSTPGTRENALGWIRKNGGLDYRAIRDSYGLEEALQLRKRLGPGMFKTDGMPLDKAAQGLSLEGATGLDSDTALFQTLMGEGAGKTRRVVDKAAPMQSGVQALADQGQMDGVRARPGRYNSIRELVRATLQKGTRPILDKMFVDYAKVDGRSAAKIKEVTGLDVLGYDRTLTGGGIMHSVEWHGPEGKRLTQFSNQLPLTEKDILRLPEILTDPDKVELGNKAGREGEPRILSKKRIEDAYVVAEEIHSSKQRKKLVLVTMWKERAETPPATPETVSAKNGGGDVSALQTPDASGERSDSIGATLSQTTSPRLREGAGDSVGSIARSDLTGNVQNTEDVQRLAAPTSERRFFEPEKPTREAGEAVPEKPVTIAEIRQAVDRLVPWRHGKTGLGNLGIYKVGSEVARSKFPGDVSAMLHEVGHHLDKKLGLRNIDAPGVEQELASNGAVASTGQYTPEQVRGEGVAQFFLHYAVDERQAREKFPEYYRAFEDALAAHPELQGDVADIKRLVSSYSRQTAGERMQANIVRGTDKLRTTPLERAKRTGEKLYDDWVDELAPLQRLTEEMRKKKGDEYAQDSYNVYAKARTAPGFKGNAGKYQKRVLDVIRKDLKPEDRASVSNYLAAGRAMDFRENNLHPGLGLSAVEERYVYENTPQHIKDAAGKMLAIHSEAVLDTLVDGGFISRERYDYLREKWPHYVPFIRAKTEAQFRYSMNVLARGKGKNLVNLATPIKKTKGVGDDAAVMAIQDPVESILQNIDLISSLKARNDVGKAMIEISKGEGMGRYAEPVDGPGKNTFYVWENGEKKYFATDPLVYDTLMAVNREVAVPLGDVGKVMALAAETLKMGATRYNPAFPVINFIRDAGESAINSKSMVPPAAGTIRGLLIQLFPSEKNKAIMKEVVDEGLMYSGITEIRSHSPKALGKAIQKAYREGGVTDALKRRVIDVAEWVGSINEAVEVAPKIAEYYHLRSKGVPKQEAAMRGREVNIDFARKGAKGGQLNRLTAYFNPQVQGVDKVARTVKEDPRRTLTKVGLYVVLPSIATWMHGMLKGEKRRKEYEQLTRQQKDLNWFFPVGDSWMRLPKPNAYSLMGSLVERTLDAVYRKDPAAFRGFSGSVWDEAVPPIVPNLIMTGLEVWSNKSSFTGRPIVSRKYENLPPEMQYGPQTSGVAKQVGELLGVSPMKIDHIIRNTTGTAGSELVKLPDRFVGNNNREAEKWTEKPFVRRFFTDPYRNSEAIDRFYEVAEQTSQAKIRYETKRKAGEQAEVGKDLRFASQFAHASKALSDLRKKRATIQQHPSLSPASKRKYLDEMDERMVDLARGVLERYDKYGN